MLTRGQFLLSSLAASTASAFQTSPIRVDRTAIEGLFADLRHDENRDLKGVRILLNGDLAAEAFFNDSGPKRLHDIRSAGKSITSLLVGLAIDKRLIRGVDIPFTQILKAGQGSPLTKSRSNTY